jgi:hypothetical protein
VVNFLEQDFLRSEVLLQALLVEARGGDIVNHAHRHRAFGLEHRMKQGVCKGFAVGIDRRVNYFPRFSMQKPDFKLPSHPLTRPALIKELGRRFGKGILGTYPCKHGLAGNRKPIILVDDFGKMLAEERLGLIAEAASRVVEINEIAGSVESIDDVGKGLHEIRETIAAPSAISRRNAGALPHRVEV